MKTLEKYEYYIRKIPDFLDENLKYDYLEKQINNASKLIKN
jgi:hypothetical protein